MKKAIIVECITRIVIEERDENLKTTISKTKQKILDDLAENLSKWCDDEEENKGDVYICHKNLKMDKVNGGARVFTRGKLYKSVENNWGIQLIDDEGDLHGINKKWEKYFTKL